MRKVVLGFMVVIAITSFASGATQIYTEWRGTGAEVGNWSDTTWSAGTPFVGDAANVQGAAHSGSFCKVGFKTPGKYPLLTSGTYGADIMVFGGANPSNLPDLVVDGATINISEYITLAAGSTDVGYLTMKSGTINTGVNFNNVRFYLSQLGTGTLDMQGGTIVIGQNYPTPAGTYGDLYVSGTSGAGNGHLNMTGGNIYAAGIYKGTGTGAITISSRTAAIWLLGDKQAMAQQAMDDGWLVGGDGYTVQYEYDDFSNITKVFATPEPATVCLLGLGVLGLIRRK